MADSSKADRPASLDRPSLVAAAKALRAANAAGGSPKVAWEELSLGSQMQWLEEAAAAIRTYLNLSGVGGLAKAAVDLATAAAALPMAENVMHAGITPSLYANAVAELHEADRRFRAAVLALRTSDDPIEAPAAADSAATKRATEAFVEERRASIRRGARPAGKRFNG